MRESERTGSMSRREFLRRALVGAAVASTALVVGEQMFEQLARLTPRPVLWGLSEATYPLLSAHTGAGERLTMDKIKRAQAQIYGVSLQEWDRLLKTAYAQPIIESIKSATPFRDQIARSGSVLCRA